MLFDTDVIIWVFRGNAKASAALDSAPKRLLSVVSFMELLRGARDKAEMRTVKNFLASNGFQIVPLSENIGHRASIYMEEHCLKTRLEMPDALLAATAVENRLPLCTANWRHFTVITELQIEQVRP